MKDIVLFVLLGLGCFFFEDGIGFHFLLEEGAELHDGGLQKMQGLLHLG